MDDSEKVDNIEPQSFPIILRSIDATIIIQVKLWTGITNHKKNVCKIILWLLEFLFVAEIRDKLERHKFNQLCS